MIDSNNQDNIKQIHSPAEALEQFVGDQFTEWLMNFVASEVRSWPEIQRIGTATPKIERVRKFMLQRFLAAEAFLGGREGDPGFLGFAIANLSESADPQAESALELLEKKRDEEIAGHTTERGIVQTAHREMWSKLLRALGVTDEEIDRSEAKDMTRNYIAELSDLYSNSEWQTAMGAFGAQERSAPEEYDAIIKMLRGSAQIKGSDMEVLTWHTGVDYKYVMNTAKILEKSVFDRESKDLVWDGVNRQLTVRREFYAGLSKYLDDK